MRRHGHLHDPVAQIINFIALNSNAFNNAQVTVQAITDDNKAVQVNAQAQHADSLLQQQIDSAVTTFNLAKQSSDQSTKQDTSQSTASTNNIYEAANAEQENSGFAKTVANTDNTAFQQSSGTSCHRHQDATNKANAFNDTNSSSSASANNHADALQAASALNSAKAANSASATNSASNFANNNAFGNNFAQTLNNSLVPVAGGPSAPSRCSPTLCRTACSTTGRACWPRPTTRRPRTTRRARTTPPSIAPSRTRTTARRRTTPPT